MRGRDRTVPLWLVRIMVPCVALGLLSPSCSTKKNTAVHRFYHRTTSYFNYYHNAKEAYAEGLSDAEKKVRYDYSRPLPLSLAGLAESAQEVGGSMDRTIDKCADLIRYHSLTVKPSRGKEALTPREKAFYSQNEFNPYARKAWLLIGKARVWANDLSQARQSLDFAMRQFPQQTEGWEAELWMARVDALEGDTVTARNRLQALAASPQRPGNRKANFLLWAFWADLHVQRGALAEALPYATKALALAQGNRERTRVEMAIAQMQEEVGNAMAAYTLYKRVANHSSDYELRFNALIRSLGVATQTEDRGMERTLRAMAQESKNNDYLDQIYFAMGRIAIARGDTAEGIELYKQAAASSTNNSQQKGIAFLHVGEYYYSRGEYLQAQSFFDSAVSVLPESYSRYDELMRKSVGLTRLASSIRTVRHEDSLQRVARLPENERMELIQTIIERVKEEDRQAKQVQEREQMDRTFATMNQHRTGQNSGTNQGQGWYFYNTSMLSFGRSDFRLKWGDRKLEDNWRRKSKGTTSSMESEEAKPTDSAHTVTDKHSAQYYLQYLPLNDSLLRLSNSRILNALMQSAEAYNHEVQDPRKAIKAYQEVSQRYPKQEEAAQALYLAYRIAQDYALPEISTIRESLLTRFGQTGYAQIVSDPTYLVRLQEQRMGWETLYKRGIMALLAQSREEAQRIAEEGIRQTARSDYEERFALLAALSAGSEAGSNASIQALKGIEQRYPKSESAEYASEVLRAIDRKALTGNAGVMDIAPTPEKIPTEITQGGYTASEGLYWLAILLPADKTLQEWNFKVLDFSVDYNVDLNLETNHEPMDDGLAAVVVRHFENRKLAESFRAALVREKIFEGRTPVMLVISPENFERLKREKSYALYRRFYTSTYGTVAQDNE